MSKRTLSGRIRGCGYTAQVTHFQLHGGLKEASGVMGTRRGSLPGGEVGLNKKEQWLSSMVLRKISGSLVTPSRLSGGHKEASGVMGTRRGSLLSRER